MAAPLSVLAALARLAGVGSRAAPAARMGAAETTRAQQIAREAIADRGAARAATQQRMASMAERGAMTGRGASPAGPMSANSALLAAGVGAPMLSFPLDYLPQRAQGDPAAAVNRRNAPQMGNVSVPLPPDQMPDAQDVITRQLIAEGYEPGYYGDAGRRMSGAALAMQPEPGYSGAAGRVMADAARRYGFNVAPETTGSTARPAAAPVAERAGRGLFGDDYQSTSQRVVERPQGPTRDGAPQRAVLNWGDEGSAADFFRADKAMREMREKGEQFEGRASGGKVGAGAGGKDAAIHKALEIIHHLLTRR